MSADEFRERLRGEICKSFDVLEDGHNRWIIQTPCSFDDGDLLPVIVHRADDGTWAMTDDGLTISHLFFDDFQFTDARLARVHTLVDSAGAEISQHHALRLRLDGTPTPYDIGDFLQLLAQIQGVALTSRSEREQTRYVRSIRARVEQRLASADFEENWSPPQLDATRASYRADLRLAADGRSAHRLP